MKLTEISREQILKRITLDNPWRKEPHRVDKFYRDFSPRPYVKLFRPLAENRAVHRAVVLMGPRRVGKTVMLHHVIQELIDSGFPPQRILYFPIDTPLYAGHSLEELFQLGIKANGQRINSRFYVFFDEIQYLKNWDQHLKSLVDSYRKVKFIVTGSAAAALRRKSRESGAGRFTDFLLPPLTFYEYLEMKGNSNAVTIIGQDEDDGPTFGYDDIGNLNDLFIDYMNYGGYPEVIHSESIRENPGRYLRDDIIGKVLLKDLPGLYGIQDIQELNSLFTTLAYNTGNEVSLDALSKSSGVAKNTIKRYLEYLESAFLIKIIRRINYAGKKFLRDNFFKVYLSNASMRTALFGEINSDDKFMGNMVETAIFSQWLHGETAELYYARWKDGEVDLVSAGHGPIRWAVEIKWSNKPTTDISRLSNLTQFAIKNQISSPMVTTVDIQKNIKYKGLNLEFTPASLYCYTVGRNRIESRRIVANPN